MLENIGIELKKIVDEHGRNILLDTYMVKAMLSDYAPQKTKGRMLLYFALEQGIGRYYADQLPDEPKDALIEQTAELLGAVFAEDCIEAVTYTFFYALGWDKDDAVQSLRRWKEKKRRMSEEEERKRQAEEQRKIEEERRRIAEERRRIAEEQRRIKEERKKIEEEQKKIQEKQQEEEQKEKKFMEKQYKKSCEELKDGYYENALKSFRELGDYKDSALQMKICSETLEELSHKNVPGIVIIILILYFAVNHIAVPLPDDESQFFIFAIEVFVAAILIPTQSNRNSLAETALYIYPLLYPFYLFPSAMIEGGTGWFAAVFTSLLVSAIIIANVGFVGAWIGTSIATKADRKVYLQVKQKYKKK